MFERQWTQYSKADYEKLDNSQRIMIDKALARVIIKGCEAGQPLKGNLAGCYKMKHQKLGLRIVMRDIDNQPTIIEIVAIGKRERSTVYKNAEKRL